MVKVQKTIMIMVIGMATCIVDRMKRVYYCCLQFDCYIFNCMVYELYYCYWRLQLMALNKVKNKRLLITYNSSQPFKPL